jgi:hypothetical protein
MINGNEGGRNGGGTPTEYAPVAGAWSGLGIALRLMDADAEPVILALRRPSGLR